MEKVIKTLRRVAKEEKKAAIQESNRVRYGRHTAFKEAADLIETEIMIQSKIEKDS